MKLFADYTNRSLRQLEPYAKTDVVYLASGGFWLVLGQAGAALTSFAFSLAVANFLPAATYGSYRYILSLVAMIGALSLTGLGTTVVRAIAQGRDSELALSFSKSVRWSPPMLVTFIGVAAYYGLKGGHELSLAILIAGLATVLINAASLHNAYWNGKQDFYRATLYWSIANVAATGAAIASIVYSGSLLTLVAAFFLTSALANGYLYFLTARQILPGVTSSESASDTDSAHLSFLNFLNTIAAHADKIIVFQMLGAAQLAIYTFALALPDQMRAILKAGARLALPRFAERSFHEIQRSLGSRLLRFGSVILVMAIAYIFIAPYIFGILFPTYMASIPYSQLFALTLFTTLGTIPLAALQAHAKIRALYMHAIIANVVQITSSVVLIYFFGLWGAAGAVVFNRLVNLLVPLYLFRQQ